MKYSIIVPVFNRPDEVDELLVSLLTQSFTDFEVIIVEDGSQKPCEDICKKYADRINLHYFMKPNSGPGQSRNYGAERTFVSIPTTFFHKGDSIALHIDTYKGEVVKGFAL